MTRNSREFFHALLIEVLHEIWSFMASCLVVKFPKSFPLGIDLAIEFWSKSIICPLIFLPFPAWSWNLCRATIFSRPKCCQEVAPAHSAAGFHRKHHKRLSHGATWCNVVHVSPTVTNLEIDWDKNKLTTNNDFRIAGDKQNHGKILLTNEFFHSTTVSACQPSITCDTLKRHVQSQMPANSQSREWSVNKWISEQMTNE